MHLPVPNLDDLRFQDLVDEAKRRIPRYCPEWTDHNVSDPGITLIELFAWMTEQYVFRLNQVPDKNFVTFLDLIGVKLAPAEAAKGEVTFTLTAPPTGGRRVIIPQWTQVATVRTETEEAIVFTTDYGVEVLPATLRCVLKSEEQESPNREYEDHSSILGDGGLVEIWGHPPAAPNELLLGFEEDLSAHTLVLNFECDTMGIGIDPKRPPWTWKAWCGANSEWRPVQVVNDSTGGLNHTGLVRLRLPYDLQPKRLARHDAGTWITCAPVIELPPGETPYRQSPRIRKIESYSIGITVPVTHAIPVGPETLGVSNGQSGQTFRLQSSPILKPEGAEEVIQVSTPDDNWETWSLVSDFGDSGEGDRHYTLDPLTGEVEFGPAVRRRDGSEPQCGAIPPLGATIQMLRYRIGGGIRGNVAAGRVTVLKSTVPYIERVVNPTDITGGLEPQSLEEAKLTGPALLRTRHRAVTADDFEFLSQQVPGVGRVRCLPLTPGQAPKAGTVTLAVIPDLPKLTGDTLKKHIEKHEAISLESERLARERELQQELVLTQDVERRLRSYLDNVKLLTTNLDICRPNYVWVAVQTQVETLPKANPARVLMDVKAALYRFLHPIWGGPDGTGWQFGRALTIDKVYALIQSVPGVEYAIKVILYPVDLSGTTGGRLDKSKDVIEVGPNGVIVSYYHNVYSSTSRAQGTRAT